MTDYYVRSTDGDNGDSGATWALAKATIAGVASIDAAGDTIYVSQAHAESTAAAVSLAFAGTNANPTRIIGVSDAAEPPTAVSTAPTVTTTGASNLQMIGAIYAYGIKWVCGNGSNFANLRVNYASGSTSSYTQVYEQCDLNLSDTHPSSVIVIGDIDAGSSSKTVLLNSRLKLSSTSQLIQLAGNIVVNGGSFISGTSTPTAGLFLIGGASKDLFATIDNFDFSNLSSSLKLFTAPVASPSSKQARIVMRNCKMPTSWGFADSDWMNGTLAAACFRLEAYNCDNGDTNWKLYVRDLYGVITHETTIVKTGGASDGTTPISWKMVTNANANEYVGALASPEIQVWNDTAGASKTVTVDIEHDSATALTDAEVWLEITALTTSGVPLGARTTDKRASVLASAANQASSTATWTTTGQSNPNKQKLEVTFTPAEKGPFVCRVMLAKASKTIYVDPVAQVS